MASIEKGRSPFYPGQPVPRELFTGRTAEINRLITRGVGQVATGKPISIFIQGEYGIGKSSIAAMVEAVAETKYSMHCIHAYLGGAKNLDDVARMILEATVKSDALNPTKSERIRSWLSKYVGKQELFGFSVDLSALKADAPKIASASSILTFLRDVKTKVGGEESRGIVLVLDEINGITGNPLFSHFIKGLVDENATTGEPLPLLLLVCGVEERRREMIFHHPPIDRVFDIVEVGVMTKPEMKEFFERAFESADMTVKPTALDDLILYSAGLPKIMHVIGDSAYWTDSDSVIDDDDAENAIIAAADDIGKKFVDQQVLKAIRSNDYRSTLEKIAKANPLQKAFKKAEIASLLNDDEKRKLNNFLTKMKQLNVIKQGDEAGDYEFTVRMVRIYLWLHSLRQQGA